MRIFTLGHARYLLTGNRPYYRMKIYNNGGLLPWGRDYYTGGGPITILLASQNLIRSLEDYLKVMGYSCSITFLGDEEDEKINPLSPHFRKLLVSEVTVMTEDLDKLLKDLQVFNKEREIKIMYYHKKSDFIIA